MQRRSRGVLLALVAVLAMSAVTATSAFASGKPLVETKPATTITKSEATLNGTVDPNGAETTYHFEYGTSTSYGKSTAEVYVGSGTTSVEELQKVASLLADQGYDFRIVAKNSNGTTNGSNEAFTTSGPKVPLAETLGASAVTETGGFAGATLNGVVNPNGVETKYYFQYGTTISYGKETAAVSAGAGTANLNESKAITGLTAKTTYHFRIVATNANGTTDGPDETLYSAVASEFKPFPAKRKFTASGGKVSVSMSLGQTLECAANSSAGEITGGRTLGKVTMVLTGCKGKSGSGSSCPVYSEGAKEGEIVTKSLSAELGTLVPSGVGLMYKPEKGKEWLTLEGSCVSAGSVGGTIAQEVSPVGVKQSTSKFSWSEIKEIKLDSGTTEKPRLTFFSGTFEIEAAASTVTFEEAVEVT
jgi:hypothetical protein